MRGQGLVFAAGVFNGLFAVFHMFFWKLFNWPASLAALDATNRELMPIFNIHTVFVLVFFAYACFAHAKDLAQIRMGRRVSLAIGGFWILRTVNEFLYFDSAQPKSQILAAVFVSGAALSLVPLLLNRSRTVPAS